MLRFTMCCVLGLASATAFSAEPTTPVKSLAQELPSVAPKEPKEALKSFRVRNGFRMELAAHEPNVIDPIAGVFDAAGRLYVLEMRDYPFERPKGQELGSVRLLEDADGDGFYEKSTVFAEGIGWPTGLNLWKKGLFVVAAPDLWYLEDTDGDGKADVRKIVLTGFGKGNVQGLANGLIWGIDHRIYLASASNGGLIKNPSDPSAKPISVNGSDGRYDPRDNTLATDSGSAQYGHCFDDWYRRYVCSNSDHAQEIVFPSRYAARNPALAVGRLIASIAKEGGSGPVFRISEPEPWRVVRTRRRALTPDKYAATELFATGFFTSGSGITVYRGDAFPKEYRGNVFVGDVGGNLIHRKTLTAVGVLNSAARADEGVEFVASTDNWFRPVNYANAPDGTLYVFDMYRETIEHPVSIPEDIKAHLNLNSRNRGRIYRLAPPGFQSKAIEDISKKSTADLVSELASSNSWRRETAHRLLFERQDKSAVEPLRRLLATTDEPLGRLHALWSLDGLESLNEGDLLRGLADSSPGVREHSIRLSESRLNRSTTLLSKVVALADDKESRVRMQTALSLGEAPGPEAARGLARIARTDSGDSWIRTAILSSVGESAGDVLSSLMQESNLTDQAKEFLRSLATLVGSKRKPEVMEPVLATIQSAKIPDAVTMHVLWGFSNGCRQSGGRLTDVLAQSSQKSAVEGLLDKAPEAAGKAELSIADRTAAVGLLSLYPFEAAKEFALPLVSPQQPSEIQLAALRTLGEFSEPAVASDLLAGWRSFTPPLQTQVLETLLSRPIWTSALLDAVEQGVLPASQIPAVRVTQWRRSKDVAMKSKVERLFASSGVGPRAEVIARYKPALARPGDVAKGKAVYERECRTCHKIGADGFDVGPNLATIRSRTPDSLVEQILDPNREVLPTFVEYAVAVDDGRLLTGLIASESPTSVTLKRAMGVQETVLRRNIETMAATGKSLMPEGLEKKITPEELSDLTAFLLRGPAPSK